jgi:hypothetical protein
MGKGRGEAFTDGVIAVVITIMVPDMKVPAGSDFAALRSSPSDISGLCAELCQRRVLTQFEIVLSDGPLPRGFFRRGMVLVAASRRRQRCTQVPRDRPNSRSGARQKARSMSWPSLS